jgi:hypothetical protein
MAELLSSDKPGQNPDTGGSSGRTRTLPLGSVSECPKPWPSADVSIIVDGCTVRIVAPTQVKIDVPCRQGFAWEADARAYAERLSAERNWPIEGGGGRFVRVTPNWTPRSNFRAQLVFANRRRQRKT